MQGSNSQTMRSWPKPKLDLNGLSHPGTPHTAFEIKYRYNSVQILLKWNFNLCTPFLWQILSLCKEHFLKISWYKTRCSIRLWIWGGGKSCCAFGLDSSHKTQAFAISPGLKYKKKKEREVWVKYDHSIYFPFPKSPSPGPYKTKSEKSPQP